MRKAPRAQLLALLTLMLVLGFQNCGSQYQPASFEQIVINSRIPACERCGYFNAGGLLSAECQSNASFDACLYWKNPVAQTEQTLDPNDPQLLLRAAQVFGVKLSQLDSSGFLKNSAFQIAGEGSDSSKWAQARNGSWKFDVSEIISLAQVSAYFWLNHSVTTYESLPFVGQVYLRDRGLLVRSYVPTLTSGGQSLTNYNAYFVSPAVPNANQAAIIVGLGAADTPLALSGDILIHELSHANTYYASSGTSLTRTPTTYENCFINIKGRIDETLYAQKNLGCCKTKMGCMRAIDEGTADFHQAAMFPNKPAIGEVYENSLRGLMACPSFSQVTRNVSLNRNLTVDSVFNGCGFYNGAEAIITPGDFYMMSTLYASILWEIRNSIYRDLAPFQYGGQRLDGSQVAHLIAYEAQASLNGDDTFLTAKAKMKDAAVLVAQSLGIQLNLAAIVEAEFTRRGVN